MAHPKIGDKVTVSSDSIVPLEWRGVNATVRGVEYLRQDDGSYETVVTVEDQHEKRLDIPIHLIRPNSH